MLNTLLNIILSYRSVIFCILDYARLMSSPKLSFNFLKEPRRSSHVYSFLASFLLKKLGNWASQGNVCFPTCELFYDNLHIVVSSIILFHKSVECPGDAKKMMIQNIFCLIVLQYKDNICNAI